MYFDKHRGWYYWIALSIVIIFVIILLYINIPWSKSKMIITSNDFSSIEFGDFVEEGFPFITSALDIREIGSEFPSFNVVSRGMIIKLGNDAYACFDMDLLRWSVAWTDEFISMVLPAQGSYNDYFKRNNNELPVILGTPRFANGMYTGWSKTNSNFKDVRKQSQKVEGLYWGPIPEEFGRWNGSYVYGNSVLLSYNIHGVEIMELPSSEIINDELVFTRTFRVGKSTDKLILNIAQFDDGKSGITDANSGKLLFGSNQDSLVAAFITENEGHINIIDNKYITAEISPSNKIREFTVVIFQGESSDLERISEDVLSIKKEFPNYKNSPSHWEETIMTKGQLSPDTAAFVSDYLTLPIPNPWARNIRVADVSFFSNNRAAISTYEGDIWLVDGIDDGLENMKWKRFASGLYEPMSIEIFRDQIYTFGREGIIRYHDFNGDDEADFYENFCNIPNQSTGTREWPADMVVDKVGNFYVAKGGHLTGYEGILPYFSNSIDDIRWRSSSSHSGSILKIDSTGMEVEVIATGFRMPYLGINKKTGLVSASDQEGNYVPSSPIYFIQEGGYYGVPITAHKSISNSLEEPPDSLIVENVLTWIPHFVDRSSASQTWINSNEMGSLSNDMVHFSYGRPGIFRVLIDTVENDFNGGVVSIDAFYPAPAMKGEVSPLDGQLYFAGFNNYVSNSEGISALMRLRHTSKPSYYVNGFMTDFNGLAIMFDSPLLLSTVRSKSNFEVKRWNYKRSQKYGSGYYKLDGTPGHEILQVGSSYLSNDKKTIFIHIPDMRNSDQVEINYELKSINGELMKGSIWLTIHKLRNIDFEKLGFSPIDFSEVEIKSGQMIRQEFDISAERGKEVFNRLGCQGCHSIKGEVDGMYGPPLRGIFDKHRALNDGSFVIVDDDYIKESIYDPSAKVAKGYVAEMPSFKGILSERDISAIIIYLRLL